MDTTDDACGTTTDETTETVQAVDREGGAPIDAPVAAGPVKNLIVMIADGAGFNTLEATRLYLQALPPGDPRGGVGGPLVMDGQGWVYTAQSVYPLDTRTRPVAGQAGLEQNPVTYYSPAANYDLRPVEGNTAPVAGLAPDGYPRAFEGYDWNRRTYPDSANTATALSSGEKTYNNALNVDGNGDPVVTLAELAKSLGKATGAVSTVQVSDATPAALGGAHNESRTNRTEVAAEMFRSGVLDVVAGTGNPDYDDDGQPRAAPLYEWIGEDVWTALKEGTFRSDDGVAWRLLQDRADIAAAGTGEPGEPGGERLAMVAQAYTSHRFNRPGATPATEDPYTVPKLETSPTLTELSRAALNRLDADEDGLFVSIEGGAVDRAMHANNFGRMIEEYTEFNDAVKFVVDWVASPESRATWEDTLLIVTADHDHLLFGPEGATIPYQPVQPDRDGDGVPEYAWFSNSHSNQIVPLYAYGAEAGQVRGLADGLDLAYDERGRAFAGSGRPYTDQAELGDFLQGQLQLGATPAASGLVVQRAEIAATGGRAGGGPPRTAAPARGESTGRSGGPTPRARPPLASTDPKAAGHAAGTPTPPRPPDHAPERGGVRIRTEMSRGGDSRPPRPRAMRSPGPQRLEPAMPTIFTYLTHTGRAGAPTPRAGDRVHLRPAPGGAAAAEAWSECGCLLGRLPPAERGALAAFDAVQLLSAHVSAVVPRSGPVRSDRVILQVEAAP